MKHAFFFVVISLLLASSLTACGDTAFTNNPHGIVYLNQLTPLVAPPAVPTAKATPNASLSPYGLGASLQAIAAQYGPPTKYSSPPLYAFQDGTVEWPNGSLIIVTMKNDQAVEFSYVPSSQHRMTYQEAQGFVIKLLPSDAQGPRTLQAEDDHNGKCLAQIYHSNALSQAFPPQDFLSPEGQNNDPGSVVVNFFPYSSLDINSSYPTTGTNNVTPQLVNSLLINLGSRVYC